MIPAIGSRWRAVSGNIYEYTGRDVVDGDTTYCHALRLVERHPREMTPIGHVMCVELPWFVHAAKEVKP